MFFEFSIVPVSLIVFLFGYQPEKLHASLFLIMYTVAGRLPLLIYIISTPTAVFVGTFMTIPVTLGFLIKSPIYLLHVWLPKAHVEAPVGGSIVLAGVLLKLGSYGLLLFLPFIKHNTLTTLYFRLSLIGSSVCSLICLRQSDIKLLIAYSSVVHMGVVTLGFIRGTELGYTCGLLMVISHGFCSPFMFSCANRLYENTHSRLLLNNPRSIPLIAAIITRLIILNIGVPPSLTIWSEVFIAICVIFNIRWSWVFLIPLFLLGVVYNLFFYLSRLHSKFRLGKMTFPSKAILPVIQISFISYSSLICLDFFHIFCYEKF